MLHGKGAFRGCRKIAKLLGKDTTPHRNGMAKQRHIDNQLWMWRVRWAGPATCPCLGCTSCQSDFAGAVPLAFADSLLK
eukprot:scaffold1087_cov198-Pinguiococcus_pyrenoidosus.AAC.21